VENSLRQSLWTWRKTGHGVMMMIIIITIIIRPKRKTLLIRIPMFISAAVTNLKVAD
jgi:hypothetical protein